MIHDMDDFNPTLDDILDSLGVPVNVHAPKISNVRYDANKHMFIVPETDKDKDYKKLNQRKAIFKKGSLLKSKKSFNAFVSKVFNEDVADMYIKANTIPIDEGTVLLVLKEGIIRSKYSLSDVFAVSNFSRSKGPELCYRFIKTLAVINNAPMENRKQRNETAKYVTMLVNPDFDTEKLKTFFDFSDESIKNSNLKCKELDLTAEIESKVADRKEKFTVELMKKHNIIKEVLNDKTNKR